MVGRDAGCGVVPGPRVRRDLQTAATERRGKVGDGPVPGQGEVAAGAEARGTDGRVRQGHERVERSDALMGSEHVQVESARTVSHDGRRDGTHGRSDAGDLLVGNREQEDADTSGRRGYVVTTPEWTSDLDADGFRARRQRTGRHARVR